MFDAVRNNKKIVQVFLALITLPFAFFGVESYVRSVGAGDDVAKVGDIKITQQQFQQALREQQEKLRNQLGGRFDPKLLETPEARIAILDDLINRDLLLMEASKKNLLVGDDAVRNTIASIEAFKIDGKFSNERYESLLRAQGMSPAGFEAQLRQDLTLQQLVGAVAQSGVVSQTVGERLLSLQTEKREVMEYRLTADSFLGKVKLADDAAKKFYDENSKQFELPEQVKAEYVVFSMDAVGSQLAVSEDEIKAWYDSNKSGLMVPEERRASHILIAAEGAEKEKARAKAEDVLKEVSKNPGAFADLARKYSGDPGSAAKGGDLGFFGRGMMVKPFEEAAFGMKEGEMSGLVESDFGFHIIKVTGVRGGREKTLAEAHDEIEAELKKSQAARKFAEAADAFSNLVYSDQPDSLKPAAEKFKLAIKQTDWMTRQANPANGPFANEKLLAALFSDDAKKNKRNTEPLEVAANTLVAARVLEYKASGMQAFESVRGNIEDLLRHREAQSMALKEGEARLASLKKGEDALGWGAIKSISRMDSRLIPPVAAQSVFRADVAKLPAYVGAELSGSGYALYKIVKVDAGEKLDDARQHAMLRQISGMQAQEDARLYLAALRERYKVDINKAALEGKEH